MKRKNVEIEFSGFEINEDNLASTLLRTRLNRDIQDFQDKENIDSIKVIIINNEANIEKAYNNEDSKKIGIRLSNPLYSLDQLVIENETLQEILYSIKTFEVKSIVFDDWGLRKMEPFPKIALNFHGEPGTGKTMAAHAIANELKKKIMAISYAEIESKYHGEGPKNVKDAFLKAKENDAILFIDEADSLLSKRLLNVTQGSEQAINSMRSQLLIEIENYEGIVIFATNFVQNYDKAFTTRIKNIEFKMPNEKIRKIIWSKYLLQSIPKDGNINISKLARIKNICGRDIKNAIVGASIKAVVDKKQCLTYEYIENEIKYIISSKEKLLNNIDEPVQI